DEARVDGHRSLDGRAAQRPRLRLSSASCRCRAASRSCRWVSRFLGTDAVYLQVTAIRWALVSSCVRGPVDSLACMDATLAHVRWCCAPHYDCGLVETAPRGERRASTRTSAADPVDRSAGGRADPTRKRPA